MPNSSDGAEDRSPTQNFPFTLAHPIWFSYSTVESHHEQQQIVLRTQYGIDVLAAGIRPLAHAFDDEIKTSENAGLLSMMITGIGSSLM